MKYQPIRRLLVILSLLWAETLPAADLAAPLTAARQIAGVLPCRSMFFEVEGHSAFLFLPMASNNLPVKPWVWYAPTRPGHPDPNHVWMFRQFLEKGIAVAGVDVGESYGNPVGRKIFTSLWEKLTGEYGLAERACLMPQSRGGLMLYNWAAENPQRVACIAGIYTVCDLRSYPGLSPACPAYGMDEAALATRLSEHNPVDRLKPLADAGVPILHLHGDNDKVVPLEKNSGELARRYRVLGGSMRLMVVPGKGHEEVPEFFQCQELVDFVAAQALAQSERRTNTADTWGGRPALPAVVNPAILSPLQTVLSLRGEWEFVTRETAPLGRPGNAFYASPWPDARTIQVPGCWEAQGVGTPGMGDSWDCKWDHCAKPLRAVYMGDGWYRKTVSIPESWRGRRIWLKVGGVRSQGCFWVNQTPVAWVDNYCGTYKHDITDLVQAGTRAVVVAQVNNVLPSRKGLFSITHRFGGLYRDVELEATPDARIDYAWVRGDFDQRAAEVHVTVAYGAPTCSLRKPVLRVTFKTSDGQDAGSQIQAVVFDPRRKTAEVTCRIPLTRFEPWSPDSPALYRAELVLCDGDQPVHGWVERFGVRKFEVRGDRFFFNNKPFFVRGYGDDFVYPLTLVSPASRGEHLKHFQAARRAGFEYVRLHTHCELPEYFEAADEAGVLVQPELPYYHEHPTEAFTFDPIRDLKELIAHYRRHVSLATYCMGNEGSLGRPLDMEIYQLAKTLDPDRLVLHQDGTFNTRENSDFRNGPITVWEPGSFVCDAPFVAHEYLNLSVKQDPRLASRFSGAMLPPVSLGTRDRWLTAAGLNRRWGDACQDAAHALQSYYQKQGLEAARTDPSCDGYSFWTIVDVVVKQGNTYSAQGFLDPFWEPKANGHTPEEFQVFNAPTVLLLKTEPNQPIAVSGDRLRADFWISHFGERPLKRPRLAWALRAGKEVLAEGGGEAGDVELGVVRSLAQAEILIPELSKPVHAVLEVSLAGEAVRNQWDFWLFPTRAPQRGEGIAVSSPLLPRLSPLYSGLVAAGDPGAEQALVLISFLGSPDVEPALAAGKRVILINRTAGKPNVSLGWWAMGQQVGTAFARHPALGDFPHEGHLSPLAFRILKTGLKLPNLAGLGPDDMFVVGEGLDNYFLYAAEARIKTGRALMTFGLDLLSGHPEATCILDGLIRYAHSDAFNPRGRVDLPTMAAVPNGWQRTLKAGDVGHDHLPMNGQQLDVARAMKGQNELIWETQLVPRDAHEQSVFSLTWEGGMGYFSEPQGSFALYVNDELALDIPAISEQSTNWQNADRTISLKYERDPARPEMGRMTLSLPSSKTTPGKPLRLKVTGSDSNSRRWFGVCETICDPANPQP